MSPHAAPHSPSHATPHDPSHATGHGRAPILVVGSVNTDLVLTVPRLPAPGETLLGTGVRRSPGGKGANQACAAARLGADVRFAGRIGTGAEAELALELLRDAGVDLHATHEVPEEETGMAVVTVDENGENSIVVIAGANGSWSTAQVEALHEDVEQSGLVISQGEIPSAAVDALARLCTDCGTRFLLNLAPVIDVGTATVTAADPLVVNEHEARLALGALSEPGSLAEDASDESVVDALREAGVRSVVMTRGAQSALVRANGVCVDVPSPVVTAVDSTGAGDAFVGALATGLARGDGIEEACRLAVRVGAITVTRPGAQPSYPFGDAELPS